MSKIISSSDEREFPELDSFAEYCWMNPEKGFCDALVDWAGEYEFADKKDREFSKSLKTITKKQHGSKRKNGKC